MGSSSDVAEDFLAKFNDQAPIEAHKLEKACWDYETNVTDRTQNERIAAVLAFSEFMLKASEKARRFDSRQLPEGLARQLLLIQNFPILKDKTKILKLAEITSKMTRIYTEAKTIDPDTGQRNRSLIPALEDILARSRNYNELQYAWNGWRAVTGSALLALYKQYVELSKEAVRDSNFVDMGDYWRTQYEMGDLEELVERLWNDVKPLYLELHAYVRHKLVQVYPQVRKRHAIPANILGSMWSQDWSNIYTIVKPYAGKASLDITEALKNGNFSGEKLIRLAESFYTSLRMPKLPGSFYRLSLLEKPAGREVVCDMGEFFSKTDRGECDVRIKQCATASSKWLVNSHQQLAHAYYMLLYCDKPFLFRDSANPAFPEGIGGAISLSVTTPKYLMKVGLLNNYNGDNETVINAMMKTALRHIAFLPFSYLMDQWNRGVFNENIKDYNTKWWQLRTKHQGVKPPVSRPEDGFDPGAYYHTFSTTSYIRYFLGTILQFQFHKALCEAAGITDPPHDCSIYKSTAAGEKIKEMFKTGRSKPWPEVLEKMTGGRSIDTGALLEYYNPLYLWLREQRCVTNYTIGWLEHPGPQHDPCEEQTTHTVPTAHSGASAHVICYTTAGLTISSFLWIVFVGCLVN